MSPSGTASVATPYRLTLASLLLFLTPVLSTGEPSQEPADYARGVTLDVFVTDNRGRPVTNLTVEDFEIVEDGVSRPVGFAANALGPANLLLLLDASSSMGKKISEIRTGVSKFIQGLSAPDRARVGFFNENLEVSPNFTDDTEALATALDSVTPSGWTMLHDAVIGSLELFSSLDGRKVLLLLSDGNDTKWVGYGSDASRSDVIECVRRSDVLVYTVGIPGSNEPGINRSFLKRLAEESGSRFQLARTSSELSLALDEIVTDVHSGYRLTFTPNRGEPGGNWRPVEVRVKNGRDLDVRTRRGFYNQPTGNPKN